MKGKLPFMKGYDQMKKEMKFGEYSFPPSSRMVIESPIPSTSSSFSSTYERSAGVKHPVQTSINAGRRNAVSSTNVQSIIQPDKNIPFFIPTISLATQGTIGDYYDSSEAPIKGAGCSKSIYYPQLEAEDFVPRLEFSLYFDNPNQLFYVRLHSGSNFPTDISHYIQVKVFPGRSSTGSKQRTEDFKLESPVLNSEFIFHVRREILHTKVLKLRAMGSDKLLLGAINIAVKDIKGFEKEVPTESIRSGHLWKRLEPPGGGIGRHLTATGLQLGLKYDIEPLPGLLTLRVIEAYGLHDRTDEREFTSTYVKVILEEEGRRRVKSRKTRIIRWGSVPRYEETFVVSLPKVLLSQVSFSLILVARGKLGTKEVLGRINIGPVPFTSESEPTGIEFWADMNHSPNQEILRSIPLNP